MSTKLICVPKTMKFDGRLSEKTSHGDNWSAAINGRLPVQCPYMGYYEKKHKTYFIVVKIRQNQTIERYISPAVLFTFDTLYS